MERFIRRVRANVRVGVGMSNDAVEQLCRQICSSRFQGVFSADKIPVARLARMGDFVIVVNLGRSDMPVGHFVTLSKRERDSYVGYMDSFALPCFQPDVKKFVKICAGSGSALMSDAIRYGVRRRVQSPKSAHCGLYATLFAAYVDREPEFEMAFKLRNLAGNDERCVRYLRRIISEM